MTRVTRDDGKVVYFKEGHAGSRPDKHRVDLASICGGKPWPYQAPIHAPQRCDVLADELTHDGFGKRADDVGVADMYPEMFDSIKLGRE